MKCLWMLTVEMLIREAKHAVKESKEKCQLYPCTQSSGWLLSACWESEMMHWRDAMSWQQAAQWPIPLWEEMLEGYFGFRTRFYEGANLQRQMIRHRYNVLCGMLGLGCGGSISSEWVRVKALQSDCLGPISPLPLSLSLATATVPTSDPEQATTK